MHTGEKQKLVHMGCKKEARVGELAGEGAL